MKVPRITNAICFFDKKRLLTDANGNNAAFACPECDHPVLLATSPYYIRGMTDDKPSICRACDRKYVVSSLTETEIHMKLVE